MCRGGGWRKEWHTKLGQACVYFPGCSPSTWVSSSLCVTYRVCDNFPVVSGTLSVSYFWHYECSVVKYSIPPTACTDRHSAGNIQTLAVRRMARDVPAPLLLVTLLLTFHMLENSLRCFHHFLQFKDFKTYVWFCRFLLFNTCIHCFFFVFIF